MTFTPLKSGCIDRGLSLNRERIFFEGVRETFGGAARMVSLCLRYNDTQDTFALMNVV